MVLEVKHLASETTEQSLKKEVERTKKLGIHYAVAKPARQFGHAMQI